MISITVGLVAVALLLAVLVDGFETIIQPRRVSRHLRAAFFIQDITSRMWYAAARHIDNKSQRERILSVYGPLSLFLLMGNWALGLIVGFGLLLWAFGSPITVPQGEANLAYDIYYSGSTFTTLGLGDITPTGWAGRVISVVESGLGLSSLGLIIAYLPVLYQDYSQREVRVSMLDEWAGSPANALELLRRLVKSQDLESLELFLKEWEMWSAELLESHLSYPVLGYFRSQHENQSWVTALTMLLDVCTLALVGLDKHQFPAARRTFAIARHALVDLTQVYGVDVYKARADRLDPEARDRVRGALASMGLCLREGTEADEKMASLRGMYEPYAKALAERLLMPLPSWLPLESAHDNWRTTPLGSDEGF